MYQLLLQYLRVGLTFLAVGKRGGSSFTV